MKISKLIVRFRRIIRKSIGFFKNLLDSEDIKAIRDFIVDVSINGIMLNFALSVTGLFPFTWYSWIGFGFAYRLVDRKVVKWLRSIIHKN